MSRFPDASSYFCKSMWLRGFEFQLYNYCKSCITITVLLLYDAVWRYNYNYCMILFACITITLIILFAGITFACTVLFAGITITIVGYCLQVCSGVLWEQHHGCARNNLWNDEVSHQCRHCAWGTLFTLFQLIIQCTV